jgi:structure-specific endonuclease subunit SLX1
MYYCYLLKCTNRNDPLKIKTYIGLTNNLEHRLRQHNMEIKGGAKATHGFDCEFDKIVGIFPTKSLALKFEYKWKHTKLHKLRSDILLELLECPSYKEYRLNILTTIH